MLRKREYIYKRKGVVQRKLSSRILRAPKPSWASGKSDLNAADPPLIVKFFDLLFTRN